MTSTPILGRSWNELATELMDTYLIRRKKRNCINDKSAVCCAAKKYNSSIDGYDLYFSASFDLDDVCTTATCRALARANTPMYLRREAFLNKAHL